MEARFPGAQAVLLAAGESTRMGELKALLPWEGDRPLIEYQVRQLLDAGVERLVIVLGHRRAEVGARVPGDPRIQVVTNLAYRSGKVSSIIAGTQACAAGAHVLILGVDQPRPAGLVRAVVDAHGVGGAGGERRITIAGYKGRRGHPVVFSPALRADLLGISEATEGLRSVLRTHASVVNVVDTANPLALVNLNTPDDYARARALAGLDEVGLQGAGRGPVHE